MAIFILIAIVFIFSIVAFFYISNPNIRSESIDAVLITGYISSCLDDSVKNGVLKTGLREADLNKYILNSLESCDLQVFEKEGFDISEEDVVLKTEISNKEVVVKADYSLSIAKNGVSVKVDEFYSSLDLQKTIPITNEEFTVGSEDGVLQLNIPANINALLDDDHISNIHIDMIDSSGDANIFSPIIYNLRPSGSKFFPNLVLNMDYSDSNLPRNFNENNLRILIRENSDSEWKALHTNTDLSKKILTANISHFSDVGIGRTKCL